MSKASDRFQVVVLCEDNHHYHFVRGFLMKRHANARFVPRTPVPGAGSGRAYVERGFHREVAATKNRNTRARTRLVVVVDGDGDTLSTVARTLERSSYPGAPDENHVALVVPRRNIETWLSFAAGLTVNEWDDYKRPGGIAISAKKAGEQLAEQFSTSPTQCPELPALENARDQYTKAFADL